MPEMDRLTAALESTARELYRRERDALVDDVRKGAFTDSILRPGGAMSMVLEKGAIIAVG
jgi:hypothetical protein